MPVVDGLILRPFREIVDVKYSIRDLFLVTVIVALGVASSMVWLDRQRLAKENVQLRSEAKAREKEIEETLLKVIALLPKVKPRNELGESRNLSPDEARGFPPPPASSAPAPNPPKK
jgi:hypothetical protein